MLIKTHKELKEYIQGKKILHLNSLGKDSVICLDWLVNYAKLGNIISVWFRPLAFHNDDGRYLNYLKKRYPTVTFKDEFYTPEFSDIASGVYQDPFDIMEYSNKEEQKYFSFEQCIEEIMVENDCEYRCMGHSKYESMSRAMQFHKKGIVWDGKIFPLGMMKKSDIMKIIKLSGIKLHPCYKYLKSTLDTPSYYKMRSAFILSPEYEKRVLSVYPLLDLDKYRYERML